MDRYNVYPNASGSGYGLHHHVESYSFSFGPSSRSSLIGPATKTTMISAESSLRLDTVRSTPMLGVPTDKGLANDR